MAIPYSAIAAAAALAAGAALKGEEGRALNNGPDYIRDGNPTGVVDKIGQAIARNTCRRYADNPDAVDGERALDFEKVCRPYLDNIGYGEGPEVGLPFRGGQCNNQTYLITVSFESGPEESPSTAFIHAKHKGPIQGARVEGGGVGIVSRGGAQVSSSSETNPFGCGGAQVVPDNNPLMFRLIVSNARNPRVVSITPCGVDDCGNPEVDVRQPIPPENPDDNPEPFNPGPDIDINIDVGINVDGSINIDVGTGPIVINPFGGGGDGGGPGGEPGEDPDTSPPAPEPGPENPGGNGGFGGDDMFGEPPAGRRWVGCCIRITQTPANASVIATSEPEDVYPGVIGNIRLVCDAAGNRFTDTPVRILAKHVCVWEPVQKINPVGVRVDLLPGYGYVFRPYSVPSGD